MWTLSKWLDHYEFLEEQAFCWPAAFTADATAALTRNFKNRIYLFVTVRVNVACLVSGYSIGRILNQW
jgi:hypothetical protein